MSTTISCYLMGGLGNQLFQIFNTLSYGIDNDCNIVFPYSEILTTGTVRPTYWNSFLYHLNKFTTNSARNKYTNTHLQQFPIYKEKSFTYNCIPLFDNHKEVMLYGYFQSYRYFQKNEINIFSLIHLGENQDKIKYEYRNLFDTINPCVSMHFRIGDYKNIQHMHPILPYNYYEKSIKKLLDCTDNKCFRVLYLCQDVDNSTVEPFIKRLKNKYNSVEFIKVNDSIVDWKQMLIMSCCKYNIIANSTFSWWGAYFNQNKDKIVCYPFQWFGSAIKHSISHLFPLSWYQISYNNSFIKN